MSGEEAALGASLTDGAKPKQSPSKARPQFNLRALLTVRNLTIVIALFLAILAILSVTRHWVYYTGVTQGVVNADGVALRAFPSIESQKLAVYQSNAPISIDGRNMAGDWLRVVRVGDKQRYWMHAQYVTLPVSIQALPIDPSTRYAEWSYMGFLLLALGGACLWIDRREEKDDMLMLGFALAVTFLLPADPRVRLAQIGMCFIAAYPIYLGVTKGDIDFTIVYYWFGAVAVAGGMLNTVGNFAGLGPTQSAANVCAVLAITVALYEVFRQKCKITWFLVLIGGVIVSLISFYGASPLLIVAVIVAVAAGIPSYIMTSKEESPCADWKPVHDKIWLATDVGGFLLVVMIIFSMLA